MKPHRTIFIVSLLSTAWIGASSRGQANDGGEVTFATNIAPIIHERCASCHRPSGAAPFSLLTYDDVRKRGRQIGEVVSSRYMPPWLHEPGYGEFLGERRLSKDEIQHITTWIERGMPPGNQDETRSTPPLPEAWQLGEPDVIVCMDHPFVVPPEGNDIVHSFVFPLEIAADRYVRAVEYLPTNPRVIHHVSFLVDDTGSARILDGASEGPGYPGMGSIGFNHPGSLGSWSPGSKESLLPNGTGRFLPAGGDIVAEVHFYPTGKVETEQGSIGLYFAEKPVSRTVTAVTLGSHEIDIAPGDSNYVVSDSFILPVDAQLVGLTPHAHFVCREMKLYVVLPDGLFAQVLWIKDWDFNWQQEFLYRKPIDLPAGTKLEMQFTYDNSAANLQNPFDPPRRVLTGHKLSDEMALLFLHVTVTDSADLATLKEAHRQQQIARQKAGIEFRKTLHDLN